MPKTNRNTHTRTHTHTHAYAGKNLTVPDAVLLSWCGILQILASSEMYYYVFNLYVYLSDVSVCIYTTCACIGISKPKTVWEKWNACVCIALRIPIHGRRTGTHIRSPSQAVCDLASNSGEERELRIRQRKKEKSWFESNGKRKHWRGTSLRCLLRIMYSLKLHSNRTLYECVHN